MAKKPTQKEALLKLLSKGKPVDFIKAFHYTGCTKLGTRVSELIRKGFKFKKQTVCHTTRYKTHGYHVVYTLDVKHAKKNKLI